jgi:hypothetical protein
VHNYVWDLESLKHPAAYQLIADRAIEVELQAGAAADWAGLESLTTNASSLTVSGPGLARLKFEQEGACWVEFESDDLAASGARVALTISENNLPAPLETHAPTRHNSTWRLEPNAQLYEGVRYAWLNVSAADTGRFAPFRITRFRRACQVVPTNYRGHFESSDADLDRIWWVGAYTVRVTLCGEGLGGGDRHQAPGVFLGSELMDRGDRIAFLGDAHVVQATALAAFGNYGVLASSNNYTKDIGNSIEPWTRALEPLHNDYLCRRIASSSVLNALQVLGDVGALCARLLGRHRRRSGDRAAAAVDGHAARARAHPRSQGGGRRRGAALVA